MKLYGWKVKFSRTATYSCWPEGRESVILEPEKGGSMTFDNKQLGKRIKDCRQAAGFSQEKSSRRQTSNPGSSGFCRVADYNVRYV